MAEGLTLVADSKHTRLEMLMTFQTLFSRLPKM